MSAIKTFLTTNFLTCVAAMLVTPTAQSMPIDQAQAKSQAQSVSQAVPESDAAYVLPINYGPYHSVTEWANGLTQRQEAFKKQLMVIDQRVNSLHLFLSAQQSLHLNWVDELNGATAPDALKVAFGDGQSTQICHAQFKDGTHPGMLVNGGCLITYAGSAMILQAYQVLVGSTNTQWMKINNLADYQKINDSANDNLWKAKSLPIMGGFENMKPLYICAAAYNGVSHVGKIISTIGYKVSSAPAIPVANDAPAHRFELVSNSACNIAVDGKEKAVTDFMVLFGG